MPGIADRLKLVVEWWPAVVLVQEIAGSRAGQSRAVAVSGLLRFLATKTEIEYDDRIAELVQKVVMTKEGGELIDYVASIINRPAAS